MSAPRFSLRVLLVAITYAAVVLLALLSGSLTWADSIYTCTIAIILVATLAGLFIRDERRVFWRGFCYVAWTYMFFVLGPWAESNLHTNLMTHHALEKLQRLIAPIHAAHYASPGFDVRPDNEWRYQIGPTSYFDVFQTGCWQATQRTGHSVWAVLLGLIGGYLAMYFGRQNKFEPTANATQSNIL